MAFRLSGNDDGVVVEQGLDQGLVFLGDRLAIAAVEDFGTEDGVVFREGVVAFEFKAGLGAAGDAVEEGGGFKGGDEGVADAAEHGVVGPDGEGVFAVLGELAGVMKGVGLEAIVVAVGQVGGDRGVDAPLAVGDVVEGDQSGDWGGVIACGIDPEDRVEDLHGAVGVHRGDDGGDLAQVAVDEFAEAVGVVDRALTVGAADVELEVGLAEGVLDVDREEGDAAIVVGGGLDVVLGGPGGGGGGEVLVGDAPDLGDAIALVVGWDGELGGGHGWWCCFYTMYSILVLK